jgi:hypothetical protein
MSREQHEPSHRSMWVLLIVAVLAGLFAFWFIKERET